MNTFEEWVQTSENLLKRNYCLTLADAGFEQSGLESAWRNGERPFDFVRRMALKFDLTSKADLWLL